jgi:hypothetical protein
MDGHRIKTYYKNLLMPGIIKILMPNGTKEKEVHYYSTNEWKSIINSWVTLYGDRINDLNIHIVPDRECNKHLNNQNYKL